MSAFGTKRTFADTPVRLGAATGSSLHSRHRLPSLPRKLVLRDNETSRQVFSLGRGTNWRRLTYGEKTYWGWGCLPAKSKRVTGCTPPLPRDRSEAFGSRGHNCAAQ